MIWVLYSLSQQFSKVLKPAPLHIRFSVFSTLAAPALTNTAPIAPAPATLSSVPLALARAAQGPLAWQSFSFHRFSISVKLLRSPSNCWDPIQSKIDPLLLPQLHSNHPLRLQHYANQTLKLWAPPETSDALPSLSENSKRPLRTPITFLSSSVFIILF